MPPFHCSMGAHSNNSLLFPPWPPLPCYVACIFCDVVVLAAVICSSATTAATASNTESRTSYSERGSRFIAIHRKIRFYFLQFVPCPGTSLARTNSLEELFGGHNKA